MKTNLGLTDQVIRMFLGISISMVFIYHGSIWAILGLIPFVTGIIGTCHIYNILGIDNVEADHS